jgi:hypothetical protein
LMRDFYMLSEKQCQGIRSFYGYFCRSVTF